MSNYNEIQDYEIRKQFLEDLKMLNKSEKEEIFRILKENSCIYSENSNGVFFDVSKLSQNTFNLMIKFIDFCKKNRKDFEIRENEEKKVQEILDNHTAMV
jgi:hypothetical protein